VSFGGSGILIGQHLLPHRQVFAFTPEAPLAGQLQGVLQFADTLFIFRFQLADMLLVFRFQLADMLFVFRFLRVKPVMEDIDVMGLCCQQVLRQAAQFVRVIGGVQDVGCHTAMLTEGGDNIRVRGRVFVIVFSDYYSVHAGSGPAERRSQSTPAVSQVNCSAVSVQVSSPVRGQWKVPW
jgi:hypothetical protein